MKRIMKFWDVLLVALLGMIASGCNINEPPPAEYGPEPEYGVFYSTQINVELEENNR